MTAIRTFGILLASLALIGVAEAQKGGGKIDAKLRGTCLELFNGNYVSDLTELVYLAPFSANLSDNPPTARRDGLATINFATATTTATLEFIFTEHRIDGTGTNEARQLWSGSYEIDQTTCEGRASLNLSEGSAEVSTFVFVFVINEIGESVSYTRLESSVEDSIFVDSKGDAYRVGSCPRSIISTYTYNADINSVASSHLSRSLALLNASGTVEVNTELGIVRDSYKLVQFPVCDNGECGTSERVGVNELTLVFDPNTCRYSISIEYLPQYFVRFRGAFAESGQRIVTANHYLDPSDFAQALDYRGSATLVQ